MKKFSLILAFVWCVVMCFVIYKAVTNLKQLDTEKNYLEDRSEIYYP